MATLAEALAFASKYGLRIFPLPIGEKRPDIKGFPELATNDPTRIAQLWRDPINGSRDLNIGVLAGNGIVIWDIDTKGDKKFNRSAVGNFYKIGGHFDTLVVKTGSGGYQAYFSLPNGKTYMNAQSVVPGNDIRCENGYGIGPGSFALESGGAYEIENDAPIAPIPDSLLALLKPIKTRKERFNGYADSEKAIPLYIDYLERVEPAIEGQGGDQHTYNVACMGVSDYGLTEPTVTNLMLEYFNPRCEPPWDADELQKKVENAEQYAIGKTGSRDPDKIMDGLTYMPVAIPATSNRVIVYKGGLMSESVIKQPDWIIHPMAAPGEVTLFSGPGGTGKSTFLIALACFAAVGRSFGPYLIERPLEVFLYNPEDSLNVISGRAVAICKTYGLDYDEVRTRFDAVSELEGGLTFAERDNRSGQIIMPQATHDFFTKYKANHPNLAVVIADPMRKILVGIDENDNAQMSRSMQICNRFARGFGVSLITPHHTVKNLMARKDLDFNSPDLAVGAGSVSSSARIALNVLPQSLEDQEIQGKHENWFSTRIAKNSFGPSGQVQWWERKLVHVNNYPYPVPIAVNIQEMKTVYEQVAIDAIGDYITHNNVSDLTVAQAAALLTEVWPHRAFRAACEALRILFGRGNKHHAYIDTMTGIHYRIHLMAEDGNRAQKFVLDPEAGQTMPLPVQY